MVKLTEKKRKWIINQFRGGRSATSIARIQKISRQMVYKLMVKYREDGPEAYKAKKAGRPSQKINPAFSNKVVLIRKETDYGSEKLHFVFKKEGFNVSQRQIQKILDKKGLTEPCEKRRGQRKYVRYQWPISNLMWHCDYSQYKGKWYITFLDDRSRRIMAAGEFDTANERNAILLLYQELITHKEIKADDQLPPVFPVLIYTAKDNLPDFIVPAKYYTPYGTFTIG